MSRTAVFGLAVLIVPMVAGVCSAAVKTSEIMLKSGNEEIKAFVAEPEGKGPFPGVVVIQEWWGLTDWIKENAKHLAEQGYLAVAPDLYRGKIAKTPAEAQPLMNGLPRDRALRDLEAATAYLAARPNINKNKLGSIGWCMGGGYSLQLAMHDPRIVACVICYGRLVEDAAKLKPMKAEVLGIFGEEDRGIPPRAVHQFEAAEKEAGKTVQVHIYKAGHGFMRPNKPGQPNPAYNAEAANDAWKKVDAFLARVLAAK